MAQYDNQYELQKQKVRDEEQQRRKLEQEALQRRLSSRGFTAGSGYAETQQRKSDIENLSGERNRLRDIDINQLAAGEVAAESEKSRQWQTGERVGSQQFSSGEREATQRYGTGEREATQKYGTQERLGQQEYGTQERLGTQKFEGEQAKEERSLERDLRQQEIDNQALQAVSELDFKYWAQEAGYTEDERERAWQDAQATKTRNYESTQAALNRQQEIDMADLQDYLTKGQMELESTLTQNANALKTRTDYMFSLGTNGVDADKIDTSNWSDLDWESYNFGRQGKYKEDKDKYIQNRIDLRNQLILTLAEKPDLKEEIKEIWDDYSDIFSGFDAQERAIY